MTILKNNFPFIFLTRRTKLVKDATLTTSARLPRIHVTNTAYSPLSACSYSTQRQAYNTLSSSTVQPYYQTNIPTQKALFSNAAVVSEESAPQKKRTRRTLQDHEKDPILVTPRAEARILELLNGPNAKGAIGIRLGVRRRGCNGLSYTLNYAMERPEKDIAMQTPTQKINVFIEPMALFNGTCRKRTCTVFAVRDLFVVVSPFQKAEHHLTGVFLSFFWLFCSASYNRLRWVMKFVDCLFLVVGTTMDWEETELTSEFTFNNPNSKGECGCGESFTV